MTQTHLTYRAAGWVSDSRTHGCRLTSIEQSGIPDDALLAAAREEGDKFIARNGGTLEVGMWGWNNLYVGQPAFDRSSEPTAEYEKEAEGSLTQAVRFPYDSRPPKDTAHWAAQGVLANFSDRGGLGHILDELDDGLRQEVVEVVASIIRCAIKTSPLKP